MSEPRYTLRYYPSPGGASAYIYDRHNCYRAVWILCRHGLHRLEREAVATLERFEGEHDTWLAEAAA